MATAAKNPYDTAIYVRVKRMADTYFVVCDEYDEVSALKGRVMDYLQQSGVKVPDDFSVDDVRLTIKNRVTLFLFTHLNLDP